MNEYCNDVVFKTLVDAESALKQLKDTISNHGTASMAYLRDLAGIPYKSYISQKYGWTDIRNAKVVKSNDGYILQLPKAVQIV